jgi:hypothetical protein
MRDRDGAGQLFHPGFAPVAAVALVISSAWSGTAGAAPVPSARSRPIPATTTATLPSLTQLPATRPITAVSAGDGSGTRLGPWRADYRFGVINGFGGEGLATVTEAEQPTIDLRGSLSIPAGLVALGWTHIGDPGSWRGDVFDAYQAGRATRVSDAKMFRVTAASGQVTDYVHRLVPVEAVNNSFAAISPDGQWLVSGEWHTERRLLVFPTPLVNPEAPASHAGDLPLAATISLDRPVRDVQGCAFTSPTVLLCSSDDPGTDLWPTDHQLLEVRLPHALDGSATTATVTSLGRLPEQSICPGTFEPEGIDYEARTGELRVEVNPPAPCDLTTTVYDYRRA